MPFGLSFAAVNSFHVAVSLIALALGLPVVAGLLRGRSSEPIVIAYLATSIATSASGFLFPFGRFLPSHAFGVVSLIALALAMAGRYGLRGSPRGALLFAAGSILAFYLNAFVGVVQAFQKIGGLRQLAPNGTEPPFAASQALLLALFAFVSLLIVRNARRRRASLA